MYKRENRRPASNVIPETNTAQNEEKTEPIIPNEAIKQTEQFEEPIAIPDYEENPKEEIKNSIPEIPNDESESDNNVYTGGGNSTYYKDSSLFRPENSKKSVSKPLTARKTEPEKKQAERTKEPLNPAAVTVRKDSDRAKNVSMEKGAKIVDKIFKTSFKIEDLVFYAVLFLLVSGKADDEIVVMVGLFILAST